MKALVDSLSAMSTLHARPTATAGRLAEELVSLLNPDSAAADRYRALRYSVETLTSEGRLSVLAVTSPDTGDGKTVTVLNLAGAFAQAEGARVLVIDGDLRRPSISNYVGLETSATGLSRALKHPDVALDDIARRLDPYNLWIVPAGPPDPAPSEMLSSPAFAGLIHQARRSFDCVLIDTPPALVPDCRLIGRWVDGFLVVVTAHKTSRKLLTQALDEVGPSRILGFVFNKDDRPPGGYYGYYAGRPDDRQPSRPRWPRSTA